MDKVSQITGIAAPVEENNVNTDILIRIDRLLAHPKGALGPFCFEAWRYRDDGTENPDFVLNRPPYRDCPILITGSNFGCGSSREPAVWALWDMGVRCIIAPGFGDIFRSNCFQNGLLPIVLDAGTVEALSRQAHRFETDTPPPPPFQIDLETLSILTPDGESIAFRIDPLRRLSLLEGLDEIMLTMRSEDRIATFQAENRKNRPWLYDMHLDQ